MDMFSLEDDEEMNNLFITQTPSANSDKIVKNDKGDEDYNMFLGVAENDFQSPCSSLVTKDDSVFKYSDISDDELVGNEKISVPNDR